MRYIAKESGAALRGETKERDESARQLVLVGGLSLYHTALQWLIESRSPHRVVVHPATPGIDTDLMRDADMILLDHDVEHVDSRVGYVQQLLEAVAPRPVLLISTGTDGNALQDLLRLGIAGVVLKSSPCDVLLSAVESVCRGKVWLQREVLARSFADSSHARRFCSQADRVAQLTTREREIIAVACTGMTNRQISDRMMISEATVRHHLSAIFGKLGVANRGELIVFAYRHRLIDDQAMERYC